MLGERKTVVLLFITILIANCWFIHFIGNESWNATSRFLLTYSLGSEGSPIIDYSHQSTGDKVFFRGHFYSDKAPGLSLVAAGPFWLLSKTGLNSEKMMRYLLNLFTNGVISAFGALVFWALLRDLDWAKGRWRLILTLGWALGSAAWPFSTVFYGHQPAAVFLLGSFWLLVRQKKQLARDLKTSALAGFLAGAAITLEYPAALPALILTGYAFLPPSRGKKRLLWLAGIALPLVLLAYYNWSCFGSIFNTGYSYHFTYDHSEGLMGIGIPRLHALYGVTFSPYRGILYSSPFLIMVIPGAWFLLRRPQKKEAWVCVVILIAHLLFNSGFAYWDGVGSFTARHLICVLPFGCLLVAGIRPPWRNPATILILLSILIMLIVGATEPRAEWKVQSPLLYFNFFLFFQGLLSDNLISWLGVKAFWGVGLLVFILIGLITALTRSYRGFWPEAFSKTSRRNCIFLVLVVWIALILTGWEDPIRRRFDQTESLFRYWRIKGEIPWDELEQRYLSLAEQEPWYRPPLDRLAQLAEARGRLDQAIACYERIISLDPSDRGALLELSGLYAQTGKIQKGRQILETLIEKYPDFTSAQLQLAYWEMNLGRPQEARKILETLERENSDDQRLLEQIQTLLTQLE